MGIGALNAVNQIGGANNAAFNASQGWLDTLNLSPNVGQNGQQDTSQIRNLINQLMQNISQNNTMSQMSSQLQNMISSSPQTSSPRGSSSQAVDPHESGIAGGESDWTKDRQIVLPDGTVVSMTAGGKNDLLQGTKVYGNIKQALADGMPTDNLAVYKQGKNGQQYLQQVKPGDFNPNALPQGKSNGGGTIGNGGNYTSQGGWQLSRSADGNSLNFVSPTGQSFGEVPTIING